MNRRQFLAGSAGMIAGSALAASAPVQISIDSSQKSRPIPKDFTGLGYEISSVAVPGLLSGRNESYVQLVRTLSHSGSIRIGGNTSDYSSFSPNGPSVSSPKGTVVSNADLRNLATFLEATNWDLIWGLNLGSNNVQQVVDEAVAVSSLIGMRLRAFEIGNEPDLFGGGTAHRPADFKYGDYLQEFRKYRGAIRQRLPGASFAGPDAAVATDWVTQFAAQEASDLKLLTHHYYRQCAGPTSTLDKLMFPDPKLAPMLAKLKAASAESKLPYRICETNSFCGGGQPGVSDTFGAALWVLDFMFNLAVNDCAGINIETGVNQLGFVSSYSPITGGENGGFIARPAYYGMLAFAQASKGQPVGTACDPKGINLAAYAVVGDRGDVSLTIINKDQTRDADIVIDGMPGPAARAIRLTAPSMESKDGVRLGGATVRADGHWQPTMIEAVSVARGRSKIAVPAGSAVLVSSSGETR